MGTRDSMDDMAKTIRVLVSFVGNRDPYPDKDEQPGPLLSFLLHNEVDKAFLLCSSALYLERAQDLVREAKDEGLLTRFEPLHFFVQDVVDYGAIWDQLLKTLQNLKLQVDESLPARIGVDWLFLLDSGTPQMKSSLFFAAAMGYFPATVYQGIPPEFSGGSYRSRRVDLEPFAPLQRGGVGGLPPGPEPSLSVAYPAGSDAPLPGNAGLFKDALERAQRVAQYDEPVLLLGETGTGKTIIARRIHELSSRKSGPFVEVNCSAIARELAESELFGHVQGAFTGANKNRSGKFRAAHRGTLFLDEIGDLPVDLQVKLLKALEDQSIYPVGSDESVPVDVRLIAATHKDLVHMVREGTFRADLYQRLKVVVIKLPPLRERREDILPLAEYFLAERNRKYGESRYLSGDVKNLFIRYPWPGNIRELKNTIDSACSISLKDCIEPEALSEELLALLRTGEVQASPGPQDRIGYGIATPAGSPILPPEGIDLRARLLQIEWSYVSAALRASGGNREAAAKLLGMTGHSFRKALRERLAGFLENEWEGE